MYKNKNKWLSAIFAIALMAVVSLSFSFKASHGDKKVFATKWYQYNGGATNAPANYSLMASQPANSSQAAALCPGNTNICVIQAPEGPSGHPANFSDSLLDEIGLALDHNTESNNVKLRD